jgi:hypothetical protein
MLMMWTGLLGTMYLASTAVPNTSMKDWAKDEAEERLRRREAGLDVKFGINYAVLRALGKDEPDADDDEDA